MPPDKSQLLPETLDADLTDAEIDDQLDEEEDEDGDLIDGYDTPGVGYDPYTRWKDENL